MAEATISGVYVRNKFHKNEGALFVTIMVEILCLIIFVFLSVYLLKMQHIGQENLKNSGSLRYKSFLLADQLRQSSDDLTRMVRSYTVSGDTQFEDYFWDVLAIRNGKKPRPFNYERVYWDFMTVKNPVPPFKDGKQVSLDKLMLEAGFTEKEFQLLSDAKQVSDKLVSLERIAMYAMKGHFQDESGEFSIRGEPDPKLARETLFGGEYHEAKRGIMSQINEFFKTIDQRTSQSFIQADSEVKFYQWALYFAFVALILNGLLLLLTTYAYQKLSVGKLKAAIYEKSLELDERKQAEGALLEKSDLLEAVHEANPDLQFVLDMNGVITNYHTHAESDLYVTPQNFIGKAMQEVLPAEVGQQFKNAFDTAATSNSLVTLEYVLPMPTGDRTFEARIVSLQDKRVVITVRDITERIYMEEEILKARKLESIGVLAGGIAHDFNNILAGLFGNIELAKLKLPQDHVAFTYIETANQALERATNLTKQLLTFAKGGDPLLETVNIKQVIRDSIEFNLSGSNIRTILNLPDNLWQGKVDKGQISQVVANLTINAMQAMPDGGVLTIDAENIKDIKENTAPHLSGDYVKISMRDEGVGISDKNFGKIFDPYFTTKQTGSGLGLATVHSIVAKHNGHISIDSKLGIGTTFTLYFPAEIFANQATDKIHSSVSEKSNSILGHILVMDDEVMIRELSADMLKSCGYTVDSAADGKEALEMYISAANSDDPFDIVIMDLTVPGGMGGKEAINELYAIDPKAKVVVSSGYATDPIMANYSDYGFKGRLAKPFKMVDMQKEISRVMELG